MKLLVTGFEPFGKFSVNSSERAVSLLPKSLAGHEIVTAILPVSYTRSANVLLEVLRSQRPDAIVCVGQNASAAEIRVESTAGNYAHSEEEDADHNLWLYRSIDMSGAPSYRSTLPNEEILRNLKKAEIAAEMSHSAGTFVCNCLMYQALRACETDFAGTLCGFIHVPALPEQCEDPAKEPCMALESIVEALRIAIATVIDPESDGILPAEADGVAAANTIANEATSVNADASAVEEESEETDDDDDFGMAVGVTPEMLAAAAADDDDDDDVKPSVYTDEERTTYTAAATDAAAASAEIATADAEAAEAAAEADDEEGDEPSEAPAAGVSAASAAMAYFKKTKRDKRIAEKQDIAASEVYYGAKRHATPTDAKTESVLKRISGSVPEKITTTTDAPRETLFEAARERLVVDTGDYRVFNVKSKYKGSAEVEPQMTLTEFMDEFIPEREKTELELKEEAARTLIHEGDARDKRSSEERRNLRKEARRKENEKEHVVFGDLYVMSETMRAMGKTLNKSVLVDDDIHMLLYTAIEDGSDIVAYHIAELDPKGKVKKDGEIGVFPTYASEFEKYYLFRALTEHKKIVMDPETYEIRLEDIQA